MSHGARLNPQTLEKFRKDLRQAVQRSLPTGRKPYKKTGRSVSSKFLLPTQINVDDLMMHSSTRSTRLSEQKQSDER